MHVLPLDLARGAQTHARALRDRLDGEGAEHRTMTLFSSTGGPLEPDLSLGLRDGRWRTAGLHPLAVSRLGRVLRRQRPEVVVAHGGEPLKYTAIAMPTGMPLVYHKIGLVSGKLRNPLRRRLYRTLGRRANIVVGVSEEAAAEARVIFDLPRDRVVVIPNGRDPSLFAPRSDPAPRVAPRVIFVGHLVDTKRPGLFIEVVRRVKERGIDLEAQLVGGGPLLESLREQAREANVELMGRREDVPQLLAQADLFVFTSVSEGEGMPGVLIEAGLAGLPVVTTRVPGAATVVDDGTSGFVVPVDSEDDLVEAVARLAVESQLRIEMGRAARARCLEHFTVESSARDWKTLLDRVVTGTANG